jgi:signal transduction histidine kinase
MGNGDKRDPHERGSTDEGLRSERERTDTELANRSAAVRDVATTVIEKAREKADSVLSDARDREDRKHSAGAAVTDAREREDAILESARSGADAVARDERERRQVALASLLAFEREYTDLRLETERENADQALTSREDFMAMVSHDLRSLLGAIALSAELLKEVEKAERPFDKVRGYADRIHRFTARMNRLVGDLMDMASIEAGKLGLVLVRRNATLLLREAMDAFEPAARARKIQLRCESGDDPGVVELDHERMLQVLTNLVGNALKFTPENGEIVIRLERRGDDLCLSVTDSGCGIPAELLEKVFERYFQSEDGARRGLGLGLFISKSIVEGHGGKIWAESTPGHGCTFHLTVPCPIASAPAEYAAS